MTIVGEVVGINYGEVNTEEMEEGIRQTTDDKMQKVSVFLFVCLV